MIYVNAIKTRILHPGEGLLSFILEAISNAELLCGKILIVTSKIVSLAENKIISKKSVASKADLIKSEADIYIAESAFATHLTIKEGLFISSAGIDESNCEGDFYILYPKDPYASAKKLWMQLSEHFGINNFGVLFSDSHTVPLRAGVTGITLAHWGFRGNVSKVGCRDIFGAPLKMTTINIADAIAAAAVLVMGESNECCPLALCSYTDAEFGEFPFSDELRIAPNNDLYRKLFDPYLK